MIATIMNNGLSEWVKHHAAHAAPGVLSPCAAKQKGVLMPFAEAEQAIFAVLKDAVSAPRFFDLPDGKKLVWMLRRALQVGAEMSLRQECIAPGRTAGPKQAARRVLRDAASHPHFFDLSDAERLSWMLERAFVLGAQAAAPRSATRRTKAKGKR